MRRVLEQIGVTAAVLILMTATLGDYGMAWDEGYAIECQERIGEWCARVVGVASPATRAWSPATSLLEPRAAYLARAGAAAESPWSRESLRFFWPFAREAPIGHPPGFAILGRVGWLLGHRFLPRPDAYRFGPAALFAVTVGAMYGSEARRRGRAAGAMAALGLLTMPRVFAHAHLASFDAPTLCFWYLGVAAFLRAVEPPPGDGGRGPARGWALAFGLAWGCAAATKFTGWLLPIPLVAWTIFYRDGRAGRTLLVGALVAAGVVYAATPTWWAEPIAGLRVFFESNLTRRQHSAIPSQFLGVVYPFALPWYNTLVWTAIVVPPATLLLALVGIVRVAAGRFRDRAATLMLLAWGFFMVLRALPAAPGHDGERQFLPAFAFLAALAGVGVATLADLMSRQIGPRLARAIAGLVAVAAIAAGAASTARFHPVQLSYYNALIGGVSGAARAGMEPTYYWDALTPAARGWINAHTDPGRSVMIAYPVAPFEYLNRWGLLVPPVFLDPAHPPQWYVVQDRPGILRSYPNLKLAAALLRAARPTYAVTAPGAPDVPLVAIYPIEEAARIEASLADEPPTPGPP